MKLKPLFTLLYFFTITISYSNAQLYHDSVNTGNTEKELITNFKVSLNNTYKGNDSINLILSNSYDGWYLFEVVMPNNISNTLYFAKEYDYNTLYSIDTFKIADLKANNKEINTPIEFIYFMIKSNEVKDTLALQSVINNNGYFTDCTIKIGDVPLPQYHHSKTIYKDSISFKNIYFNFSPNLFNQYIYIPPYFDEDGKGKITTGGGGFREYIWIEKNENGVFLIEHYNNQH